MTSDADLLHKNGFCGFHKLDQVGFESEWLYMVAVL